MSRGFIELLAKPGKRILIDWGEIVVVSTPSGADCLSIASPEAPLTVLLRNNTEIEVFGLSAASIMIAMQSQGRIDGWLPLP